MRIEFQESRYLAFTRYGLAVILAVLLLTFTAAFATAENVRTNLRGASTLEETEAKIEKFIETRRKQLESYRKRLLKEIDLTVRQAMRSTDDPDVARLWLANIQRDRERYEAERILPTCDELLMPVIRYADATQKLIGGIDQYRKKIAVLSIRNFDQQKAVARLDQLETEIQELLGGRIEIHSGDNWDGIRESPNGAVTLKLRVNQAEGNVFTGELHQKYPGHSVDIMRVEGKREGHLIVMRTNGMIRGKHRELEFRGYAIGNRIVTSVQGTTAHGTAAEGWVSLTK